MIYANHPSILQDKFATELENQKKSPSPRPIQEFVDTNFSQVEQEYLQELSKRKNWKIDFLVRKKANATVNLTIGSKLNKTNDSAPGNVSPIFRPNEKEPSKIYRIYKADKKERKSLEVNVKNKETERVNLEKNVRKLPVIKKAVQERNTDAIGEQKVNIEKSFSKNSTTHKSRNSESRSLESRYNFLRQSKYSEYLSEEFTMQFQNRIKKYYKSVKEHYSPSYDLKKALDLQMRSGAPPNFSRIRDIPKVRLFTFKKF